MATKVTISGRVQGVGFRAFTRQLAQRHGVTGWVMNLPDGRVQAVMQGDAAQVDAMLAHLAQGPRHGHVDGLERSEIPDGAWDTFLIER